MTRTRSPVYVLTPAILSAAIQCPVLRANKWSEPINIAMAQFGINTPMRVAHFLAQIGHESARLLYTREIASGKAYEGRLDLGNTQVGDGARFRGRGLIQITGRSNTMRCCDALGIPRDKFELLETPEYAAKSAAWFWSTHKLNELADLDLLTKITRIINGGSNGLENRRLLLSTSKKALGLN